MPSTISPDVSSIVLDTFAVNPSSVSKVVDGNGEPLVVYHGTPGNAKGTGISTFNTKSASDEGMMMLGQGGYFTPEADHANQYAPSEMYVGYNYDVIPLRNGAAVYPVFLKIENPYRVGDNYPSNEFPGVTAGAFEAVAFTKTLQSRGYDGVMYNEFDDILDQAVVFSPTQIKSATGNTGAFDGSNSDIRYSSTAKTGNKYGNRELNGVFTEITGKPDTSATVEDARILQSSNKNTRTTIKAVEVKGENSDVIRQIAKIFGLRAVFYREFNSDGTPRTAGYVNQHSGFVDRTQRNTIYLNADGTKHLIFVMAQGSDNNSGLQNETITPAKNISAVEQMILDKEADNIGVPLEFVDVKGENSDAIRRIAEMFALSVRFYQADVFEGRGGRGRGQTISGGFVGRGIPSGFTHPSDAGVLFIHTKAQSHAFFVLGHEISHAIEDTDPGGISIYYQQLSSFGRQRKIQ